MGKKDKIYKEMPNSRAEPDPGMERPVMVHRAMLGSVERMFAILTEHFGGKWPLWVSPYQVLIVPLHTECNDYALQIEQKLKNEVFYAEANVSSGTFKKKIREGQMRGFNYTLVVGPNDVANNTTGLRV